MQWFLALWHRLRSRNDRSVNEPAPVQGVSSEAPTASRQSRGPLVARWTLFGVALAIGLGFGYLHLKLRQQVRSQNIIATVGVAVTAKIEALQVVKSGGSGEGASTQSGSICSITLRYASPDGKQVTRRHRRMTDLTICNHYKTGDNIRAYIVPADDRIFVFEDERIGWYWPWIAVALFVLFTGFSMIVLRTIVGRRPYRRPA